MLFIVIFACMSYLAYSGILVAVKSRNVSQQVKKEAIRYFFLFPLMPIICSILQYLKFGLSLIWMGIVISLFLIYVNIQNKGMYIDPLTGAYNIKYMVNQFWISFRKVSSGQKRFLFIMMVDVDNFKKINDKYGHVAGDTTLREIHRVFQETTDNDYCVGRYGGDEFIIIGTSMRMVEIEQFQIQLEENVGHLYEQHVLPFPVSISTGVCVTEDLRGVTIESLVKEADTRMYKAKRIKKQMAPARI